MKWLQYLISILASLGLGYVFLMCLLFIICVFFSIIIAVC